jgi:hypothetical protein
MPRQPRLLFVGLVNDPGSDRIVAAMGRLGALCGVMAGRRAFAACSRFANEVFPLPRLAKFVPARFCLAPRLRDITSAWRPDMIIPLDDLAARVLREPGFGQSAGPEVQGLVETSLGASVNFATACSRQRLVDLASKLGVRVPMQEPVLDRASVLCTASKIGYPVVLKRDQTCGGAGVAIASDAAALTRSFSHASTMSTLKGWLGWIPGFRTPGARLTLQRYISGSLAFRAVACAHGAVLDGISFLAERRNPGETSASTVVRVIQQAEMIEASRKLVAALACSGFVAFDFILTGDGHAYLIEMNARPIATGHLGRLFGHDIYAAMLDHLVGAAHQAPEVVAPPRSVALFPRELDRDPASALLANPSNVLHDVPRDDPALVEAYLDWLEKRHPGQAELLRRQVELGLTTGSAQTLCFDDHPLAADAKFRSGEPASAKS